METHRNPCGDELTPAWVVSGLSMLTVAFGTGQCIGPLLSGTLSDGPNGVRAGLWLSVGILALASVIAAFQPELTEEGRGS